MTLPFYKSQDGTKILNVLLKSFDNLDSDLIKIFAHSEVLFEDGLLGHAYLLF